MKIPQSVRDLYAQIRPDYDRLKALVDGLVLSRKAARWHYESRVKEESSFALKLETGRIPNPSAPEDFFGCLLVVENRSKISEAEAFVATLFTPESRRPRDSAFTHLPPYSFDFDDLRLYVRWTDAGGKPTGLEGTLFEIQVKTFLQHAWGIATHDFIYKSDDVDWSGSRIAFQVKAMLENAELSISESQKLADSAMLKRVDEDFQNLKATIAEIKSRWDPARLPKDLRRLAQTLSEMSWTLRMRLDEIWAALDEATTAGEGVNTLNLSPYSAILAAIIKKRGADALKPLGHPQNRKRLFVPLEIDLPALPNEVAQMLVRPRGTVAPVAV